jgi:histidinol-phosphate/aromatic aminotransferase/cobyric acid decarboxylase-like protein
MYKELGRLGYAFIPSRANFILFKVQQDNRELAAKLESRSVLVQPLRFRGANWIRVSLGTSPEMRTFIGHLEDLGVAEDQLPPLSRP